MFQCPICSALRENAFAICPLCGFDTTLDWEKRPTLSCPAVRAKPRSAYIRARSQGKKQEQPKDKILDQGFCGEPFRNAKWRLFEDGRLVIQGTGKVAGEEMERVYGYSPTEGNVILADFRPYWNKWLEEIRRVELGNGITALGPMCFGGAVNLEEVVFPATLEEIGDLAFSHCASLTSVSLPERVKKVGVHAFWCCKGLKRISIPDECSEIGRAAFEDCRGLVQAALPRQLKVLKQSLFQDCENLERVMLPAGLEQIEADVFAGCRALKNLSIPAGAAVSGQAFGNGRDERKAGWQNRRRQRIRAAQRMGGILVSAAVLVGVTVAGYRLYVSSGADLLNAKKIVSWNTKRQPSSQAAAATDGGSSAAGADSVTQVENAAILEGQNQVGTYTGQMVNGVPSGQGRMEYATGEVYEGAWLDGAKNGQGTMTYTEDDPLGRITYTGEWANDAINGTGTMNLVYGTYQGEWENNMTHGWGTMTMEEGYRYEGELDHGTVSGYGTMTYPNGDVYQGQFANGTRSGEGTYTAADGSVYEGSWAEGLRNGYGILYDPNGTVLYAGNWVNDQAQS